MTAAQDVSAGALPIDMPAERTTQRIEARGSYALPIGPWADGAMLSTRTEGGIDQTGWRIDRPGITTLQILGPLREALQDSDWRVLFECDAADCGGFDFRFSTRVLPEPYMHVDLADFRFLAAMRGTGASAEHVSYLVSRSALAGWVQQIRVTPPEAFTAPLASAASGAVVDGAGEQSAQRAPLRAADGIDDPAEAFRAGRFVLEDLAFGTGAAALDEESYSSLSRLAAFMAANPEIEIALVGHTDATGGLEANIALSRRRAEAVREYLVRVHGVASRRIQAHGAGYLAPRADNQTEEGRTRNRRVEAVITSTP